MTSQTYYAGERFGLPAEGEGAIAPLRLRVLAHLIDVLVVLPPGLVVEGTWSAVYVGALAVVGLLVLPMRWGTTIGKAACRLRIVPVVDGVVLRDQRGLTLLTALGRGFEILWWPCLLLIAVLAVDDDRRTLVDRGTNTAVVEW